MVNRKKVYTLRFGTVRRYALGMGALLLACVVAFKITDAAAGGAPQSMQSVDVKMHRWLESNGAYVQRVSSPGSRFCLRVTTADEISFTIDQFVGQRDAVQLTSGIMLSPEQRHIFHVLSEAKRQRFISELARRLDGTKVVYVLFENAETVCVQEFIPLTPNFSEATFLGDVGELQAKLQFVAESIHDWLESERARLEAPDAELTELQLSV